MIVRFYVGLDKAYSEPRNVDVVVNLVGLAQDHADKLFGGSTVYRAVGSWHGEREAVAVFEVALSPEQTTDYMFGRGPWTTIRVFARWLRRAFGQKEVLVVKTQAEVEAV